MPNRIIRESLLDSHRYAGLTIESKLFFFHLLLLADDFGCISISETFLRRRAFYDSPPSTKIAKLLHELVDVDLLRTYEADRATYGFIPRFRQRLQRETLKHPIPPESLLFGDPHALNKFREINNKTENPTVTQRIPNRSPTAEEKRREEKRDEEKGGSQQSQWWKTDEGIELKALSLNIKPNHGETYYDLRQRLFQIINEKKRQDA